MPIHITFNPFIMNTLLKQISIIQRVDQLIRLQATGSASALALKLGVSKTSLYRIFKIMKALDAPVVYDTLQQRYCYLEDVRFNCGFYSNALFSKIPLTNKIPDAAKPNLQLPHSILEREQQHPTFK